MNWLLKTRGGSCARENLAQRTFSVRSTTHSLSESAVSALKYCVEQKEGRVRIGLERMLCKLLIAGG